MKFWGFIISFLVLALGVMPCADNYEGASAGKIKTELSKSHQQTGDTQKDDCSPFCHCTCCAGFSINHFVASIVVISTYKSTTQSAFLPANTFDVALPIWQPPQLV